MNVLEGHGSLIQALCRGKEVRLAVLGVLVLGLLEGRIHPTLLSLLGFVALRGDTLCKQ